MSLQNLNKYYFSISYGQVAFHVLRFVSYSTDKILMNGTSLANQSFNKNPLLIKHALH